MCTGAEASGAHRGEGGEGDAAQRPHRPPPVHPPEGAPATPAVFTIRLQASLTLCCTPTSGCCAPPASFPARLICNLLVFAVLLPLVPVSQGGPFWQDRVGCAGLRRRFLPALRSALRTDSLPDLRRCLEYDAVLWGRSSEACGHWVAGVQGRSTPPLCPAALRHHLQDKHEARR